MHRFHSRMKHTLTFLTALLLTPLLCAAAITGNRVMQLNFYVQVADGPYKGAMTEAIADPWLERGQGFEWRGSPYTSELVVDLMLQLIDMGLVAKP